MAQTDPETLIPAGHTDDGCDLYRLDSEWPTALQHDPEAGQWAAWNGRPEEPGFASPWCDAPADAVAFLPLHKETP